VREFQRHRNLENPEIGKYRAGYSDCAREVARYLATPEPLPSATVPSLNDPGSKARLLRHLDSCIHEIDSEIINTKDHSLSTRDYLRTPSTMHTECSQDSINPLDYSKINHEGALNLTKSPPTLTLHTTAPSSGDENNNNGRIFESTTTTTTSTTSTTAVAIATSTSPPLASDNFSSLMASTQNKQPQQQQQSASSKKATTTVAPNKAITNSKRNKSFADKNGDESVASSQSQTPPIPPKKAMIKSVEKERIAVIE
jgi:Hairy Orange